jgi:flagellar biosynthetic protein FliR
MSIIDLLLQSALTARLEVALLCIARAVPCIALLPLLGSKRFSNLLRVGLIVILALLLVPNVSKHHDIFLVDLAYELGLGLLVGLSTRIVWELFVLPMSLLDIATGRGSMGGPGVLDGEQQGSLQTLGTLAFLAIFSSMSLHFTAMTGWLELQPQRLTTIELTGLIDVLSLCFTYAIAIAAPALAAALLVDVTLGWANRTLSSLPAMFIAMPTRSVVGWLLVPATLTAAAYAFSTTGTEVLGAFLHP